MASSVRSASIAAFLVAFAAGGGGVDAAGFQLREQSADGVANAFAGSAAVADSPSTIWYNPAGMTRLDGVQFSGSTTLISPRTVFSGSGRSALGDSTGSRGGGDAIIDAAVGSTFALWSLSNDLKLGMAVTAPYGLRSDYPGDWIGRYFANHSAVTDITFNPNVAWRVNQNLSLGAGLSVDWIEAKLSSQIDQNALCLKMPAFVCSPATKGAIVGGARPFSDGQLGFSGDAVGVGFNAGALWEFSPQTRVGLAYRSKIDHTLEGHSWTSGALAGVYGASIAPDGRIRAGFTTPASATLSFYHEIDEHWSVMADVQWTGWSSFRTLKVTGAATGATLSETIENWRDTWFVSLGANWRFMPGHTLRLGVAYDQSAIEKATYRSVRVPDSDRYWLAGGYSWDIAPSLRWTVGAAHLFAPRVDTSLADPSLGTVNGSYDGSIDIVSTGFVYRF
jgi:long-chain fatty acid transport protein